MTILWKVVQTERETANDGITNVHWAVSDSEDVGSDPVVTHYGSSYGSCSYTPDHTAGGFTAHASVTEANAVAWVKASLGSTEVTRIETDVAAQITESKAPSTASGVPW